VLVGNFFSVSLDHPDAALKKKGFQVQTVTTESEFIKGLETADVAMFISSCKSMAFISATRKEFQDAVEKFHARGV